MSENKTLCHPASVDSLSTSAGTEDHVSMGGFAARKALRVVRNVEKVNLTQRVSIYYLLISKIYPDMRPPAKLSYRSAIHKKVVFGAVRAWTLPQIQGEVGGDQEP